MYYPCPLPSFLPPWPKQLASSGFLLAQDCGHKRAMELGSTDLVRPWTRRGKSLPTCYLWPGKS